jgi:hypothetical protein
MITRARRILSAALVAFALSAGAARADDAYTPSHPLGIADYREDTTLAGADANGVLVTSFAPTGADWRTPMIYPLYIGPIDVKAGDLLDVRLDQQYINPNSNANGWWGVNRCCDGAWVKSEHWTLWAMGADGVMAVDGAQNFVAWVLPQREENFDNFRHYMDVERAGFYRVTRDQTIYLRSRTYFVASNGYIAPPASMQMRNSYSRLQAVVYR